MADINAYQGDPALGLGTASTGGGPFGVYKFNDSINAWQRFAAYNFSSDRDKWYEANRQKDLLAAEAGKLLPFEYGDLMDNDKQLIDKAIEDYSSYFSVHPNAVRLEMGPGGKITNAAEHAELIKRRSQINNLITRGNVRKTQDTALQQQIAGLTDPDDRVKAEEWMATERKTPITQDLRLFPKLDAFNPNAFFKELVPEDIKFDELQRNPNDVVKVSTTLTNFGQGLAKFNVRYLTDPKVRRNFDNILDTFNSVLEESRGPDGKLDMEKLKKHPQGASILSMMDASNSFLDTYNGAVDKGQVKLDKIEPVQLENGINMDELGALFMSSNIAYNTARTLQETDDAIQREQLALGRANLALDRDKLRLDIDKFKNDNDAAGGELGNRAWWTLGKIAQTDGKGTIVTDQLYLNAFKIDSGEKEKVETEELDEQGNTVKHIVEQPVKRIPNNIKVYPDKSGDPNKFRVIASYRGKDGKFTYKEYTSDQVYDKMSYLTGDDKQAGVLSKMNTQFRMSKEGLNSRNVDWNKMDQFFGRGETNAPAAPASGATRLSGQVDISTLKKDQTYEVNGKLYIWNGSRLVPKQ